MNGEQIAQAGRIRRLFRECPECEAPVELSELECPYCGWELDELEDDDFLLGVGITIIEMEDGSALPF